ncbi:CybS-domain-containing protein [Lipomyces japonicus]|uniref:CybS-domain-containing protein n=1 Tax=Lipomyces japonicus TaxID=56871 RepID=UPI0034CF43C4
MAAVRSAFARPSCLALNSFKPAFARSTFRPVAGPAGGAAAVRHLGIPPIIAQPPGGIIGNANDAVKVPPADRFHGSYHWSFERLLAVGLVPLVAAPFAAGTALSPIFDSVLIGTTLLHSVVGFQSCIIDYIPLREFGIVHKVSLWLLYVGSAVTAYGFYKFETEDVGLTGAIHNIWTAEEK